MKILLNLKLASQLIYFHVKNRYSEASKLRHVKDREPPLPIYVGLKVHSLTRSKKLVNSLSTIGVSVNYKRVIELGNLLAGAVSTHFEKDSIVCPPTLQKAVHLITLTTIHHQHQHKVPFMVLE